MNENATFIEEFKKASSKIKHLGQFRLSGIMLLVIYAFVKLSGLQDGMVIRSTMQAIMVLVFELGLIPVAIVIIVWSSVKIRKMKFALYKQKEKRDQIMSQH
jgi:antibiotic biosynthesis monooxygenase (ABM) superfamily enzyme